MNIGSKLAALAAFGGGVTFILYSALARRSSTSSSITKGNNYNASHSNLDLSILLDSAREYYVKGDYKKADIFFERVLEIEPNHIDALNGKGTSLYRLADYDKAKKCFDKVLKMDPKNIAAFDNREILGKKRDDSTQKLEKPPAPSQVSTQKLEKPPAPSQVSTQKLEKPPAPSQVSTQKLEKPPAPSQDSGTISPADSRNPYNDPTLPGYNPDPDLGKKKEDDYSQKLEKPPAPSQVSTQKLEKPPAPSQVSTQKLEKPPAPSQDSGTISPADSRNPYNDPTLPGYNPDPDLGKKKEDDSRLP